MNPEPVIGATALLLESSPTGLACRAVTDIFVTMERPRLLLVPMLTEIEWVIRPLLEEWAEVASYDAPGVGDEPPVEDFGSEATARRGLEEVDRRGWDRFVIVADEFGVVGGVSPRGRSGARLQGVALGHARVSNSVDGPRPALNREVLHGLQSLLAHGPADLRAADVQDDRRRRTRAATARRSPTSGCAASRWSSRRPSTRLGRGGRRMGERLATLDVADAARPAQGCLLFTDEGFEDAVAAFPGCQRRSGAARSPARASSSCQCCVSSARSSSPPRSLTVGPYNRPPWPRPGRTSSSPANGAQRRRRTPEPEEQRRGFFRRLRENLSKSARGARRRAARDLQRPARRRDLGAARGDPDLRGRRRPHDRQGRRAPRARGRGGHDRRRGGPRAAPARAAGRGRDASATTASTSPISRRCC